MFEVIYIVAHIITIIGVMYGFYADDAQDNVTRTISSVLAALFGAGALTADILGWDILAIPVSFYILTHIYEFVADVAGTVSTLLRRVPFLGGVQSSHIEMYVGGVMYSPVIVMCLNMIVFALNEKGVCKNQSVFGIGGGCVERVLGLQ